MDFKMEQDAWKIYISGNTRSYKMTDESRKENKRIR